MKVDIETSSGLVGRVERTGKGVTYPSRDHNTKLDYVLTVQ